MRLKLHTGASAIALAATLMITPATLAKAQERLENQQSQQENGMLPAEEMIQQPQETAATDSTDSNGNSVVTEGEVVPKGIRKYQRNVPQPKTVDEMDLQYGDYGMADEDGWTHGFSRQQASENVRMLHGDRKRSDMTGRSQQLDERQATGERMDGEENVLRNFRQQDAGNQDAQSARSKGDTNSGNRMDDRGTRVLAVIRSKLPEISFERWRQANLGNGYVFSGVSDRSDRRVMVHADANGRISEIEEIVSVDNVPERLRSLVRTAVGGMRAEQVRRSIRSDHDVYYEFYGDTQRGNRVYVQIRADGRGLSAMFADTSG